MKASALFLLFLFARALMLAGRAVEWNPWTMIAFVWQDLAVCLLFSAVDASFKRAKWVWALYAMVACYVALNIPLVRTLSTPLTAALSRATGSTLGDSIKHHLTFEALACIAAALVAAAVIPLILRAGSIPLSRKTKACFLLVVGVVLLLGPTATRRAATDGLHRNVLMAYAASCLPRIAASPAAEDWSASIVACSAQNAANTAPGILAGRNVVLIALESTGAKYLKPWGARDDPMPNLTELAREARLVEQAYAVYPESIKGLYSVLCSQWVAFDAKAEDYQHVRVPSLAEALRSVGYRTALFHSGRFDYLGMREILNNRGFDLLEDAGHIGGNHESSFGVDEAAAVRRMLEWLDRLPAGERFFVHYLPIAGHHPYITQASGPFAGEGEVSRYKNALWEGDAALGTFFEGLKHRGLYTNTLFVVYGDHGEAFGEHEGNFGHTLFIYEENVRVPLLLAAPGGGLQRELIPGPRSLIDIAPTVLQLLGDASPPEWQGAPLSRPTARMALFHTDYSLGLLGLRDGPWKFIYELESRRPRLYNLSADPAEKNSVHHLLPDLARQYAERVLRWSRAERARFLSLRSDWGERALVRHP